MYLPLPPLKKTYILNYRDAYNDVKWFIIIMNPFHSNPNFFNRPLTPEQVKLSADYATFISSLARLAMPAIKVHGAVN